MTPTVMAASAVVVHESQNVSDNTACLSQVSHNAPTSAARLISGREEVSEPGAAIKVSVLHLTDEGRESLTCRGVTHIPGPTSASTVPAAQQTPALKRHALEAAKTLSEYAAAPFFPDTEKRGKVRATTADWWDGLAELIEEAQPLIARALRECTEPLARNPGACSVTDGEAKNG